MKVLVCGGREYADRAKVFDELEILNAFNMSLCVISGGATGADALAEEWARAKISKREGVSFHGFKADWKKHGKAAGPIRNQAMLDKGRPVSHKVIHRMMCEYRNGPPPTPKHHSAHCCDRGIEGCVNPTHVSWKTAAQNQLDKNLRGLATSRKISPEAANQILARKGIDRPIDLARQFNVSLRNVRLIHAGQAWKSEWFRGRRVFTADEVIAIRALKGNARVVDVAEKYNANWNQIDRIMKRKSYLWVGESVDGPAIPHPSIP